MEEKYVEEKFDCAGWRMKSERDINQDAVNCLDFAGSRGSVWKVEEGRNLKVAV